MINALFLNCVVNKIYEENDDLHMTEICLYRQVLFKSNKYF